MVICNSKFFSILVVGSYYAYKSVFKTSEFLDIDLKSPNVESGEGK